MELQLPPGTVLSVVSGSRAYGLDTDGSDVDRRGVFVAPTPDFWRLDKPPTHVEGPLPEQLSWEVERFCLLALAANPTVLECLWSPIV
jgi:predicted nucleotidyltransferase